MKYTSYDHFFMVLGSKQRIKIVQLLSAEGEMSVTVLTKLLHAEQSSISHDMRRLLLCHFVNVRKEGKERIYSVNEETIKPLFMLIEKHIKKNCIECCVHWE